jgi:glutathione synthase/RimK-type ligase-like ATP-grasp enzyme
MSRIALVTAAQARDLDDDLSPLVAAVRAAGVDPAVVNWDDTSVDWSRFDLAVLRSTWDYTLRLEEFLRWVDNASSRTMLLNPADVLRWNTDKHYLAHLADAGVPVVPSSFVEPGEDARNALGAFLITAGDEFVVKPSVGAGSRDAQRYAREESDAALAHVQRLLDANRSVLLQPYLNRVDAQGETALVFFDGAFSHAIRKGPLLKRGEGPTRALFAAEHITARVPSSEESATATRTLASIPFAQPLLYARVDVIHDDDGMPRVLELELAEPSLFFEHAPGSAERFAAAILQRCGGR